MPVTQVMGQQGQPCHVFCPWTEADLLGNLTFFLPLQPSGEKFAVAIEAFCKKFSPTFPELHHLLPQKMWAVECGKKLVGDHRMVKPVWDEPDNRIYQLADLVDHIWVQFPRKCDTSKVATCKQMRGEAVDNYLNRLTAVFNKFSGIAPPAATGALASPWEQSLITAFRQG